MDYLPIFLNVQGCRCVVVGGGATALRKVELLTRADGRVEVVAPELSSELAAWARKGQIAYRAAAFTPDCLDRAVLAIAATDDPAVNRAVAQEARARSIPVNVVDSPADCTFIMPAIVDRSPVLVAIGTGGSAPVLARLLKARLEQHLAHGLGRLASLAKEFRAKVKQRLRDGTARNRFWERVFEGPVAEFALAGRDAEARAAMVDELAGRGPIQGSVALVGAGPGDPELLTLRAARLIRDADVIVHDRLVPRAVLDMARRDAERIDVGKSAGHCALPQERIGELLIRLAREGRRVARLKGGDPFIFGRGGEEREALLAAGIRCEVVPGVTAALGCAARFGIPLTHREHAHSLVLTTGHPRQGGAIELPPVAPGQTLVIYMGLSRLAELCAELSRRGLHPETPVALVQEGTTDGERALAGTLGSIAARAAAAGFRAPALLIVGEVVRQGTFPALAADLPASAFAAPADVALPMADSRELLAVRARHPAAPPATH